MEKEEKIVVETQNSEDETIIIEETDDENDDNEFLKSLEELDKLSPEERMAKRYERITSIGAYEER